MDREIKFRVWNGIEMEYNIMVGKFGIFYVNPNNNGLDENDSASLSPYNTKYFDDIPLMLFTGFKDRNGKEIYEGDILNYTIYGDTPIPCSIIFKNTAFIIKFGEEDEDFLYEYVNKRDITLEVVGNLYQNPELLNVT